MALTALLLQKQAVPRYTRVFVTPNYTITLTDFCSEYDVGCDKVQYRSVSKTGKRLTLLGEQMMQMCADGTTPCHPIGYRFHNQGVTYTIFENGELKVTQGQKVLVDENGTWKGE